jgi:hypothetical protein
MRGLERGKLKPKLTRSDATPTESEAALVERATIDFRDPEVVLSLLEADQVVAAKRQTQFGRRKLSLGVRLLLWGLRVYVILMLLIVLLSVLRTLYGTQ